MPIYKRSKKKKERKNKTKYIYIQIMIGTLEKKFKTMYGVRLMKAC
jgi:hypothetical protein